MTPALAITIYAAMGAYLVAAGAFALGRRGAGWGLMAAAVAAGAGALVIRGTHTGHVPLQNLFEVFIVMGTLVGVVSFGCRRALKVGGQTWDALLGVVLLVPAAFVMDPSPQRLPPALQSWLFVPHVGVYLLSYVVLFRATVQALGRLLLGEGGGSGPEAPVGYAEGTRRMLLLGFPLLTLGLVLGAVWGKLAWDDYWNWDPKELWSLASWLVFLAALHLRGMVGRRHPKAVAALVVAGAVCILLTLLWANLSSLFKGLHSYA